VDTAIRLLRDLIAINSVNPLLVPGGAGEGDIARRMAAEMTAFGMDVEIFESQPGRSNVVGVIDSRVPGPTLMLCGHLDTVGVAGMEAPFDPVEHDGLLFGRGAADMKSGLALMVDAARTIANSGGVAAGRLILAGVADEEYTSLGAEELVRRWHADAAVIAEPTEMKIIVGHKGFSWVEVTIHGVAAHGSRPAEGRDAIIKMGRVLQGLESLERRLSTSSPHPLLGNASLHASLITGGRELSTYPDLCQLQIERRTIIGEDTEVALREVEEILSTIRSEDPEFKGSAKLMFCRGPYETPLDHDLPQILKKLLTRRNYPAQLEGGTFWCDAAILGAAGIPSIVFGPRGGGIHGLEEYIRVEDVLTCRDVLVDLIHVFCA